MRFHLRMRFLYWFKRYKNLVGEFIWLPPTTGHIKATTDMSMLTYGETIWISAFSIPQGTSVAMRVEATGFAPAFQGKQNRKNIKKLRDSISVFAQTFDAQ